MDHDVVEISVTDELEEGSPLIVGLKDPKIREGIQKFKQLVESQHADLGKDKWYSRLAAFPVKLQMSENSNVLNVADGDGLDSVVGERGEKNLYRFRRSVYEMLHVLAVAPTLWNEEKVHESSSVENRGPNMKTANAARAGSAIAASGSAGKPPSQPVSTSTSGATTNVWVIVDVFLTLTQKLGLWIYNLVPKLPVPLTGLTIVFSWLQFPALGWELAFTLPDLEKRGFLYWIMLLFGLCLPFYLSTVIYLDDGKVPVYLDSESASSVIGGTNNTEIILSIFTFLLGVALVGAGPAIGNSEVTGLGVITLLFSITIFGWTRLKASTFERELSKHNRMPAPAYRAMRVFVCSKVFLILLRGMYIFTISALCQTIMSSVGDASRGAETGVAIVFLIPTLLVPPVAILYKARSFHEEYVEPQGFGKDTEQGFLEYRGWLERFAIREHNTSMLDATMAELLMPFQPDRWFYGVVQLVERALVTMFATFLMHAKAQLALAIVIESGAALLEWQFTPFTDDKEDTFNLRWRMIASSILLLLLLVELIGEPFAVAGDVLVVILVFLSFVFFIYAIDIPRIVRMMRLNAAVNNFRKHKLVYDEDSIPRTDIVTMGDLAIEAIPDNLDLGRNLESAFAAVPDAFEAGEVVRDAWSFTQQYRVLSRADEDVGALQQVLLKRVMWRVEPIVTLYGSKLGGPIPSCIGAYGNVTKLILSDMGLDDNCSLRPLQAMVRLELLELDGNLFRDTIPGLESLCFEKFSLSLANLRQWSGEGNQGLVEALDRGQGTKFLSLNLTGSDGFAHAKAPISLKFVEFVKSVPSFIDVRGRKVDHQRGLSHAVMTEHIYESLDQVKMEGESESELQQRYRQQHQGYFDALGFADTQFRLGGVPLANLKRIGLFSAERSRNAGYSLKELRAAGYTVGDVKELGENGLISARELRAVGYPVKEIYGARADLDAFELERGGFSYKEMALEAGIRIAEPPLSISLIKLKDRGEVQSLTAEELCRMGYSLDDFVSSGIEREVSFTRDDYQRAAKALIE